MAGNSLDSLLEWMRNPQNEVMWGWNAIAAMARGKTNTLLLQEYITRFASGSYLPPISGEVEIVGGQWKEYIHDFILDAPRLSFENANMNDSRATLTCAIMGGSQLSMHHEVGTWQVVTVNEIDPLEGPKLILQLNLDRVPGDVLDDGRVRLDLRESSDFKLTFIDTPQGQRLGGNFFKDLFERLDDCQRVWVLGRIEPGLHSLMTPESFKLRTQASGAAARDKRSPAYGDGAVLVFIRMKGSPEGGGVNPEYRYLIPDDAGADYSATVVLERERTLLAAVLTEIGSVINSDDFKINYENGHVKTVVAKAGGLKIIGKGYPIVVWPLQPLVVASVGDFTLPAASSEPLTLIFYGSQVDLRWKTAKNTNITFAVFKVGQAPVTKTSTMECSVDVSTRYELQDDPDQGLLLKQMSMDYDVDVRYLNTLFSKESPHPAEDDIDWVAVYAAFASFYITTIAPGELQERVKDAFKSEFPLDTAMAPFIQDSIKLAFGQAIEGDVIHAPRDVGFFGRINPIRTSFLITPIEPVMAAGGSQQFTTEPVVEGLNWAVMPLPDHNGEVGSITQDGRYQAPAAGAIDGRFIRLRVSATDPESNYYSSALVTVLVNELTVNPLIQRCDAGESVELKAGALGGGELTWAIKSDVTGGGRLEPSEGGQRYVAAERLEEITYVVDEIEVTNSRTGGKKSVWVLAIHNDPPTKVTPVQEPGLFLPPGQIRLQAFFNGRLQTAEWSLPLGGPGLISVNSDDKYALYRADPATTERFVLISAVVDGGDLFGPLEGYIILPLPLEMFSAELELMTSDHPRDQVQQR